MIIEYDKWNGIIFKRHDSACSTLRRIENFLRHDRCVTVSDLQLMLGYIPNPKDNKYGWFGADRYKFRIDLNIRPGCYVLVIPPCTDILPLKRIIAVDIDDEIIETKYTITTIYKSGKIVTLTGHDTKIGGIINE